MKQYKLLNPDPACTTDNVKQAMLNVGDVCPREIETGNLMKKVSTDIKELLTSNPDQYECTLLTSSGTGSVEMVISSLNLARFGLPVYCQSAPPSQGGSIMISHSPALASKVNVPSEPISASAQPLPSIRQA